MKHTIESLKIVEDLSKKLKTFHHHYYVILDLLNSFNKEKIIYVEIGCYNGGSACLALTNNKVECYSIDLGIPIDKQETIKTINDLRPNSKHVYIEGDSQKIEIFNLLKSYIDKIDVLFIDGDHSYKGVMNDFSLYNEILNSGGYILFDDYNDSKHSPEVNRAVNDIVSSDIVKSNFEIIGTIKNIYNAYPHDIVDGNVFIIKKK
jgi:cephalosporin hydroxylase